MQHLQFPFFRLCSFIILPIALITVTSPAATPVHIPKISSAVKAANKALINYLGNYIKLS